MKLPLLGLILVVSLLSTISAADIDDKRQLEYNLMSETDEPTASSPEVIKQAAIQLFQEQGSISAAQNALLQGYSKAIKSGNRNNVGNIKAIYVYVTMHPDMPSAVDDKSKK